MRFLNLKRHPFIIFLLLFIILVLLIKWLTNFKERLEEETRLLKKNEQLLLRLKEKTTQVKSTDKFKTTEYRPPATSVTTKTGNTYFIKDNKIWVKRGEIEKEPTFDGKGENEKSFLSLSPNQTYLAYFQDLSPKEGMSNDEYYWYNYTTLRLLNLATGEVKEIYRGGFKVGDYEWLSGEFHKIMV